MTPAQQSMSLLLRVQAVEDFNRRMAVYQSLPWWLRLLTPVPKFKRHR